MAKTDYQNINHYHSAFPEDVVARMQAIRDIIHQVVPEVEECISYQIPCFKYKGYLIYYCAFDKHLTLSSPYTVEFLERFKKELKSYKVSKSAIQFPHKDPLPLELIREMIEFRKTENLAKKKKK